MTARKQAKTAGQRLEKAITDGYELTPAEEQLLAKAVSLVDVIERIEASIAKLKDEELVVVGGNKQLCEHPLLAAQRRHNETLVKVLEAMQLPNADDLAESASTRKARKAAEARWLKRVD